MSVEKNIQFTNFKEGFILFKDLGSLPCNLYKHTLNRNDISNDQNFLKKSKIIAVDFRDIFMDIHKYINEKYKDKISIDHIDYCDNSTFRLKGYKVINIIANTTGDKISKTLKDFDLHIHLSDLSYYYTKCLVNNYVDKYCKYYDYCNVEFRYELEYVLTYENATKCFKSIDKKTKDVSNKSYFHYLLNSNYTSAFIESLEQDLTEIIIDQLNNYKEDEIGITNIKESDEIDIEEKCIKVSNIYNELRGENYNVRCRSGLE